jgi:hypothetical protein
MSEDERSGLTRQELPDELPRSVTSNDELRPEGLSDHKRAAPPLLWALLAVLAAVAFGALLWMLNPPTERIGMPSADVVVPSAPPVRRP